MRGEWRLRALALALLVGGVFLCTANALRAADVEAVVHDNTKGIVVPRERKSCLYWERMGNLRELPEHDVAASAVLLPGWEGEGVVVFRDPLPVKFPFNPGAVGTYSLRVGSVAGGAYAPFALRLNGREIYRPEPSPAGAVASARIVEVRTDDCWAHGNELEIIPVGAGQMAFVFLDHEPLTFLPAPSAIFPDAVAAGKEGAFRAEGDAPVTYRFFLNNPVPFSTPYFRLSGNTTARLSAGGKTVLGIQGGKEQSALSTPEAHLWNGAELMLTITPAPGGWFRLESTPLGGGRLLAAGSLPPFLDPVPGASGWPQTQIGNGVLTATVALPDSQKGYYRGPRFEQAGLLTSLKLGEREFVSGNYPTGNAPHNPVAIDQVGGPAEEFWEPVGYDEVPVGGEFLKIGVGWMQKSQSKWYFFGAAYWQTRPLPWQIERAENALIFRQSAVAGNGYGYEYVKTVTLTPGKAELLIRHELKNTGSKRIVTTHYSHNFWLVDRQPPGPNYTLKSGFRMRVVNPLSAPEYLVKSPTEFSFKSSKTVFTQLRGNWKAADNWYVVTHAPTGASIEMRESEPSFRTALFVCVNGICPESFARIDLPPGETKVWTRTYRFNAGAPKP